MTKPVIGITMGDPAGIGPEIVVKALSDPSIRALGRFVIYGLNELLAYAADLAEFEPFWFRIQHDSPRAQRAIRDNVVVLDFDQFDGMLRSKPVPSRENGHASKTFVETAITDALRPAGDPRQLDAIVTAPISKTSWQRAGYNWPGHTELLQHRTKAKRVGMAFISPHLRVTLATIHVPLMDVRNVLTIGKVFDAIDLGYEVCRDLGISRPRLAVCGLNPHAGEGGLFGDEERRLIEPAIQIAQSNGVDVSGPFSADTIFSAAIRNGSVKQVHPDGSERPYHQQQKFDLVVAMYHDQGLIPIKLLDRDEAVNLTVGLPIIRTCPDHGTAFDIAQKNRANPGSMKQAIRLAAKLATDRLAAEIEQAAQRSAS